AAAGESKSFDADTEVAAKEEFRIQAATPGMVATEEAVVFTENAEVIGDFDVRAIALGSSKCVRPPHAHIELMIAVIFFTGRNDGLFHFLAGIGGCAGETSRG